MAGLSRSIINIIIITITIIIIIALYRSGKRHPWCSQNWPGITYGIYQVVTPLMLMLFPFVNKHSGNIRNIVLFCVSGVARKYCSLDPGI